MSLNPQSTVGTAERHLRWGARVSGYRRAMPSIQQTAHEALGFELRAEQREAVEAVLAGRDTLAVLPSGSGKSAIYEVAALLTDGPALVVSPLIALQQDQVEAVEGVEAGAALNSNRPAGERRETLERFERRELEFLLLVPEQPANEETMEQPAAGRPTMRGWRQASAPRSSGASCKTSSTSSSPRPRSGWASTSRTSASSSTTTSRNRSTPTTRKSVAADARASRRRRGSSTVRRTSAYGSSSPGRATSTRTRWRSSPRPSGHTTIPSTHVRCGTRPGSARRRSRPALTRLEEAGAIAILPTGEVTSEGEIGREEIEEAAAAQENRRTFDRSRIEMMRAYAETRDCHREFLLNYFGEGFDAPCGNCDSSEAGTNAEDPAEAPLVLGSRVRHAEWGEGDVQRHEADKIVVLFDDVGYKTLALDSS